MYFLNKKKSAQRKKSETEWRVKFGNMAWACAKWEAEDESRSCSMFNEFKLRSIKNNEIFITNTWAENKKSAWKRVKDR